MITVVAGAVLCGLVLALVAFSLFAMLRARLVADAMRKEVREVNLARDSAIEMLGGRMDAMSERIEELRAIPHGATGAPPRAGINLSRRSQALRLHRRGEPAPEIAAALGIPVQEVQLLIKVHEIVMSTV